jgi:hypothetical protein
MPAEKSTDWAAMVKKWLMDEQIFKVKLPNNENVAWAFEGSYPFMHPQPTSIVVLNPKGKDFIVIQIAIKMSPQHEEAFIRKDPDVLNMFYERFKVMLLEKDISYNIDQQANQWILTEQIYYEGLTKDHFFKDVRRVYNSSVLGNLMIEQILNSPASI